MIKFYCSENMTKQIGSTLSVYTQANKKKNINKQKTVENQAPIKTRSCGVIGMSVHSVYYLRASGNKGGGLHLGWEVYVNGGNGMFIINNEQ